jgi:phosphonate transport system substrate-binding protein
VLFLKTVNRGEVVMTRRSRQVILISAFVALSLIPVANTFGQATETVTLKGISLGLVSATHQKEIEERFREFVRYVGRKLSPAADVEGRVVVASTALQLAKLLEEKKVDFYMESPYPTYLINKQAAAVLRLRRWKGGMADYRSILFTEKDSGVKRLEDLRGKMIAFQDPGSTSGYFLPKVLLLKKGFRLAEKAGLEAKVAFSEIGYVFASSDRAIADWVLSKRVAAGAFSDDDFGALDEARKAVIAVLAETDSFPRHLVSTRRDLNPAVVKRLKEILLTMHQEDEGHRILQQTDNTTKFDFLPGGEEKVRRQLVELFRSR